MPLRLYLAGPDVFRPQPAAHGEVLKTMCAEYGFVGLYPSTTSLFLNTTGPRRRPRSIARTLRCSIQPTP